MVGTRPSAQLGPLIHDGESLERAHGLTTVVLDNTGTLTPTTLAVMRLLPISGGNGHEAPGPGGRRGGGLQASLARAVTGAAAAGASSRRQPGTSALMGVTASSLVLATLPAQSPIPGKPVWILAARPGTGSVTSTRA